MKDYIIEIETNQNSSCGEIYVEAKTDAEALRIAKKQIAEDEEISIREVEDLYQFTIRQWIVDFRDENGKSITSRRKVFEVEEEARAWYEQSKQKLNGATSVLLCYGDIYNPIDLYVDPLPTGMTIDEDLLEEHTEDNIDVLIKKFLEDDYHYVVTSFDFGYDREGKIVIDNIIWNRKKALD